MAEDKRLLRMYYEDMGIHAIHKAIGRPYSTVYLRIKSLTMNDEVLKGREFEDHVVEMLHVASNDKLTLIEWRGDKSLPGIYPESNSDPDLVFDYDGQPFAIECKWRHRLPKDICKELLPPERQTLFLQYAKEHNTPIFLLIGIGGLPSDPDNLFLTRLDADISITSICNGLTKSDELLNKITNQLTRIKSNLPNYVTKSRVTHPKAYAP